MHEFAFIATKPLQLLFAVAIIRQLGVADRSCMIVTDDFNDAEAVATRLGTADWDLSEINVHFCPERRKAERLAVDLGAQKIFVDSDVGVKRFFILLWTQIRRRRPEIWVYEEGLGTYRADLYQQPKRSMLEVAGVGTRFGGCLITTGIYIREPDDYRRRFPQGPGKARKIACSPCEAIGRDFAEWSRIFDYKPVSSSTGDRCSIYLGNWTTDTIDLEWFKSLSGDKYFKPHPHLRPGPAVAGVLTVSPTAPAELVLMDLRTKYMHIDVFHHGTSCERYMSVDGVSFVRR